MRNLSIILIEDFRQGFPYLHKWLYASESIASRSRKIPFIPQEVVKRILSHLLSDLQSLRACSLVSKSWVDPSYIYLFREVVVRLSQITKFIDHLRLSPVFPSYIYYLEIRGSPEITPDRDSPPDIPPSALGTLLSYLPRLIDLSLASVPLNPIFYYDLSTGGPQFSIKSVSIASRSVEHSSSLARTLQNFAEIDDLTIGWPSRSIAALSIAWGFSGTGDDVASNTHFPTKQQTRVDSLTLHDPQNLFLAPTPTGGNLLVITYPRSLTILVEVPAFTRTDVPDGTQVLFSEIIQRVEDFNLVLFMVYTGRLQQIIV